MIEMLWPTPIAVAHVGNDKLNRGLVEASKQMPLTRFTNIWEIDHPAIHELRGYFVEQVRLLESIRLELFGEVAVPWTTSRGWMNCHNFGDWTSPHNHSRSMYAGVYYVKAEGDCGDLLLQDPASMSGWCNYVDGKKDARVYKRVKAETGKIVLFPGHIVHCTDINRTNASRICIATNFKPENVS